MLACQLVGVSIYTKSGDCGTTGLLGGERVRKDHAQVEACGSVDEASCLIGVARAAGPPPEVERILEAVQRDLFAVGAELASPSGRRAGLGANLIDDTHIRSLEQAIDGLERELPPPVGFVLAAGTPVAAALHQARAVCRRAERRVVAASESCGLRREALVYLNRLGDLLYLLARRCNQAAGVAESGWPG